jgi:hypothetical protein
VEEVEFEKKRGNKERNGIWKKRGREERKQSLEKEGTRGEEAEFGKRGDARGGMEFEERGETRRGMNGMEWMWMRQNVDETRCGRYKMWTRRSRAEGRLTVPTTSDLLRTRMKGSFVL